MIILSTQHTDTGANTPITLHVIEPDTFGTMHSALVHDATGFLFETQVPPQYLVEQNNSLL